MATRIYNDPADFDLNQAHFTIETVNNQYYLRIGALNSEDQRLIASLIDDGFVGFFQDEVRIAIAGITSTYDAENDRIEIDRELPELQIEDEYVIRFTQARPGEDGIAPPSEDGEHAEIEIEDTKTGIRVRGKSGGEPAFGPWHDVRDGIDGEEGEDGWSPKFATVSDGERRVLQVADWFGGGGTKPDIGQYIGATGFVATIGEGVDIRGPAGEDGEDGEDGTGICTETAILTDLDGSENHRSVQLPANYTEYDEVYIAVDHKNEIRANQHKIRTLINGKAYRVAGATDAGWTENTRTFALQADGGGGKIIYVSLLRCEEGTPADLPTIGSGVIDPLAARRFKYIFYNENLERTGLGINDPYIRLREGDGTWLRVGNIVHVSLAFKLNVVSLAMKIVKMYISPPVGSVIRICQGSAAPAGGNELFTVNVFSINSADEDADTGHNEIEISPQYPAPNNRQQSGNFTSKIGASFSYEILTE